MSRLVIVANRVPVTPDGEWTPGGLIAALGPALEAPSTECSVNKSSSSVTPSMWFGWSGQQDEPPWIPQRQWSRGVEYQTVELSTDQIEGYYGEFGNRILWPLMHGLGDHAAGDPSSYAMYRAVNRYFARTLAPLLRADDLVWVHDYHLIPFAEELRRLRWRGTIGYFHHVPMADAEHWARIPCGDELATAFGAYDLIGVQTQRDVERLQSLVDPALASRVRAYPIAIDPERYRAFAQEAPPAGDFPLPGRLLFFGVERLDYTKGIPQRLAAIERAIEHDPSLAQRLSVVQWAAPSRATLPEYRAERAAVEEMASGIVARFGPSLLDIDYTAHDPAAVSAMLQRADVCLVTSLADGMNLVAKEFCALHSAEYPGVLVLSDGCGAAAELTDALVFPAGDVDALAVAIQTAVAMPLDERRRRSAALRTVVDGHDSRAWLSEFVRDLGDRARVAAFDDRTSEGTATPDPVASGEFRRGPSDESIEERVAQRLEELERDGTIPRLWARDHTLWKPEPDEISNRLGWLDVDRVMASQVSDLRDFATELEREGYTTVVLLGMGGSVLAPRMFAAAFAPVTQGLRLITLDSTVPEAIRGVEARIDPRRTLFIASSKSGTTLETCALLDYFWERAPDGRDWVAITDPGSPLEELAADRSFRRCFRNPEDIGGRYSALSFVGLVPAALLGVDLDRLLGNAAAMREACGADVSPYSNPGARLGAVLAESTLSGRDYLALEPRLAAPGFPSWLEQLVAESTGKDGTGILPLIQDRQGVALDETLHSYTVDASEIDALAGFSTPLVPVTREDPYNLGAECFRWEFGVAVAGRVLGVNPFDQPDVEAAKQAAGSILGGDTPLPGPATVRDALEGVGDQEYVAIQAYLERSREHDVRLAALRERLQSRFGVPVTVEYGPALLHSTGQYHKGGPGRGRFIQLIDDRSPSLTIPGREYDFGTLRNAQAEGDRVALERLDLRVARSSITDLEEAG